MNLSHVGPIIQSIYFPTPDIAVSGYRIGTLSALHSYRAWEPELAVQRTACAAPLPPRTIVGHPVHAAVFLMVLATDLDEPFAFLILTVSARTTCAVVFIASCPAFRA